MNEKVKVVSNIKTIEQYAKIITYIIPLICFI